MLFTEKVQENVTNSGVVSMGRDAEAQSAGARVLIVNAEPTPFDDIADAVLADAIGKTLPRIF